MNNLEEVGKHYAELFCSFIQSIMEYDKNIHALIERERSFAKQKEDYYIATLKADAKAEDCIKEVATAMIERMIWVAQDMFAPAGSSLKIDKSKVMEACGYREEDYRSHKKTVWAEFDATKVWGHLVESFGGDKGEEEGYRQTAKAIVDVFYLKPGKPIRMASGGKMILENSIYIDSIDKKFSKKNRVSYNCIEHIVRCITSLRGFAAWANFDDLAHSLYVALRQLGDYHSEITSRAIYGGNGIRIITYLNRYEYQIDPKVAEQLQVFLALYAFPTMQEAA